jgi:hypothetical protein
MEWWKKVRKEGKLGASGRDPMWGGGGVGRNKFKNMEGIANCIIPMLKNQTVNTSPHLFSLCKLRTPKAEPILAANFDSPHRYCC